MKNMKKWLPYIIVLAILITLFAVNKKWSFSVAFYLLGIITMLGIGYVIDVKKNG